MLHLPPQRVCRRYLRHSRGPLPCAGHVAAVNPHKKTTALLFPTVNISEQRCRTLPSKGSCKGSAAPTAPSCCTLTLLRWVPMHAVLEGQASLLLRITRRPSETWALALPRATCPERAGLDGTSKQGSAPCPAGEPLASSAPSNQLVHMRHDASTLLRMFA